MCDNFEKKSDLENLCHQQNIKVKESQDARITNVEDIEKLMGEFTETALVYNHENRKKATGEGYKGNDKYGSSKKNKNTGVPKSLRMVDMESEKYQNERKKKSDSVPLEQEDEDLENRSCTR
mmetsp:Transcript_1889/g.1689  ORF Transcript_1889/g.1689 Transcript_1889/m.1689 type:complete len:122 (+) Transcript_1889:278-643(+)